MQLDGAHRASVTAAYSPSQSFMRLLGAAQRASVLAAPHSRIVVAAAAGSEQQRARRRPPPANGVLRRRLHRLPADVDASAGADDGLYRRGAGPVPPFVGPVRSAIVPGRGRGLFAERDLAAGDLLMACAPLALALAPPGQQPQPEALLRALRQALAESPAAAAATAAMYDGSADSAARNPEQQQPEGIAGVDLESLVGLNAYGEPWTDVAATAARCEPFAAFLGLWPRFCLLNHDCAPNCSTLVLGRTMVVRAARAVPAGAELTISYAGPMAAAPLSPRRAALRRSFGFDCACRRCAAESRAPEQTAQALARVHAGLPEARAALEATLDAGDRSAVRACAARLHRAWMTVEGEAAAAAADGADAETTEALRLATASVLELLALAAMGDGRRRDADAEAGLLALRLRAACAYAPGSSHHASLSARALALAEREHGAGSARAAAARRRAVEAHAARYGAIGASTRAALSAGHESDALADALAAAEVGAGD